MKRRHRQGRIRFRKGDRVVVLAGRDKGREGEILKVFPKQGRVTVQGANMVKRHTAPSSSSGGGIIEKEAALNSSNIAIIDPKTGEATKIGMRFLENGRKVRYAKKSGEVLDA